jgi:hypothetical protein
MRRLNRMRVKRLRRDLLGEITAVQRRQEIPPTPSPEDVPDPITDREAFAAWVADECRRFMDAGLQGGYADGLIVAIMALEEASGIGDAQERFKILERIRNRSGLAGRIPTEGQTLLERPPYRLGRRIPQMEAR